MCSMQNKIQKIILVLVSLLCIFTSCSVLAAQNKKVLISQVSDHPALNMTTQGIIAGLEAAGYQRGVNLDLRIESAQGNVATAAQIATKFVAQQPDVVVGVGTISAQSFIKYAATKRVKLIFSTVTDPAAANLQDFKGVSNFVALEPQVELFKKLQPNLHRMGMIYNPGEINSVSIVQKMQTVCAHQNIRLVKQTVTKTADVAQAVVKLAAEVDAIFISNDNTALSSLQTIIKTAQQRNIPVYVSDTDSVVAGALAALGPNQFEIGKQTGRMIAKVLNGAELQTLAIEYPEQTELFINLEAAQTAHVVVPAAILADAKNINRRGKS